MINRKVMLPMVVYLSVLTVVLYFVHHSLRLDLITTKEIYQGVYLTVEDLDDRDGSKSRVMMILVKWDVPGVEIYNREFSYSLRPDDADQFHYRLSYSDFALYKERASVLVNTTLYVPAPIWRLFPGLPVRTNETIVQGGVVSHVHDHSYLMYWDKDLNLRTLTTKPPDTSSLNGAWEGIGLQGVQINEGKPAYNAISSRQEKFDRTFIGVNSENKTLYLFAFQDISAYTAIDYAVSVGVQFGGQLDSGQSSNLLIGYDADGITPHTGFRGSRPLGGYLVVKASRLQ